jgi:hypothetical protein
MKYVVAVPMFVALSACGGSDPDTTPMTVAKAVEGIQCVSRAETVEQLDAALRRADIHPTARSCGWDGKDRSFACGTSTLHFYVIEIPAFQSNSALALGYKAPQSYGAILAVPCQVYSSPSS